jgi:hypothetical protein
MNIWELKIHLITSDSHNIYYLRNKYSNMKLLTNIKQYKYLQAMRLKFPIIL